MKNEIGAMFWAGRDPVETLGELQALGVTCGQIGIPGDYPLDGAAKLWKQAAHEGRFEIFTVFAAYDGESYANKTAVNDSVGFVPKGTRSLREARTLAVSQFAYELGVSGIATHIGCIPEDRESKDYAEVLATVRRVCDFAMRFDQSFALETGQEPAAALLQFLVDAQRGNLGINFDPANMILYGAGDPVEALGILKDHVLSVHCKDGDWPPAGDSDALGVERPLGEGAVGMKRFLAELRRIGYAGKLAVEREAPDPAVRLNDLARGVKLLRQLQLSLS